MPTIIVFVEFASKFVRKLASAGQADNDITCIVSTKNIISLNLIALAFSFDLLTYSLAVLSLHLFYRCKNLILSLFILHMELSSTYRIEIVFWTLNSSFFVCSGDSAGGSSSSGLDPPLAHPLITSSSRE